MEYKQPKATLLHASPIAIGEIAGRVCYHSFELSENPLVKNFADNPQQFADLLKEGQDIEESKLLDTLINVFFHESVAEHITLSFHLKDISREIIIEMNRHRIGIATSQKSSRYTIEDLINAWIKFHENHNHDDWEAFVEVVKANIVHEDTKMVNTTATYISLMLEHYNAEEPLRAGLKGGAKKRQNDRVKRALPESWMLEGVWTFNLRSLKHFLELRTSGGAYYGIREVAQQLQEQIPHAYRILIDKKYRKGLTNEN